MYAITKIVCLALLTVFCICRSTDSSAQDTEPRRWSQIPSGVNFAGLAYGYASGDIFLDPVLLAEDVEFDVQKLGLAYIRSFSMFRKSARIDFSLPYIAGRWQGTVDGEFVKFRRRGPGDARMRLSVLLYGGPAETPHKFAVSEKSNTVVGAALAVTMPTGKYNSGRLINMGANRWILRPQLGVTHSRGKWTGELTGSVFLYADNNNFWQNTELETEPLLAMQAHLIYTFRPGLWVSLSTAYGWGGEATVNGDAKNNPSGNWLNAVSFGFPINSKQGVKVAYVRARTQKPTGADSDSLVLAYSLMF